MTMIMFAIMRGVIITWHTMMMGGMMIMGMMIVLKLVGGVQI